MIHKTGRCPGALDWFFGEREALTTESGVFLRPIGTAEDNPFSPPSTAGAEGEQGLDREGGVQKWLTSLGRRG